MRAPHLGTIFCLACSARAWVQPPIGAQYPRRGLDSNRASRGVRMLSARPPSSPTNLTGGRESAFAQRIITEGGKLIQDTLQVLRETGLRAPALRSVQAGIAVAETLREVAAELAQYQQGAAKDPPSTARSLRVLFERLGATYVKLGQFIASSPTLFPPDYVLEFQKCLDKTPALPWAVMSEVINRELGGAKAVAEAFEYINPEPLASASIAQVYAGRLRSGEDVAIKVQKPGTQDTLKADLGFIYIASRVLEIVAPDLARTSLSDIVADIRTSILEEVDFVKEAQHLEEFRGFLQAAQITQATCPRVYNQYSSKQVLVMERLRGTSLIDLDGIRKYTNDPEGTLITALNTWSLSVVMAPSFHADLHAGNLLVLEDGRLGFIDFGIVGRLPPKIFQGVAQLVEGVAAMDYDMMAQGLIRVGATSGAVDAGRLASDIKLVMDRIQGLDPQLVMVSDQQGVAAAVTIDEEQVTRLLLEVVDVANKNGLKLPREFGLLLKQSLYFNRYIKLLTPDLDLARDTRVQFPRGDDFIDLKPVVD